MGETVGSHVDRHLLSVPLGGSNAREQLRRIPRRRMRSQDRDVRCGCRRHRSAAETGFHLSPPRG